MTRTCILLTIVVGAGMLCVRAQAQFVVVTPSSQQIQRDSNAVVRIRANGIQHLHAYNVQVSYNPLLVRCRRVQCLGFFGSATFFSSLIDSVNGRTTVNEAVLGPGGQSGSGDLAELRFFALANGTATLTITTAEFRDTVNQVISVTPLGAIIQVGPPTSAGEISNEVPGEIRLENYPNPFNPSTTIRYAVTEGGETEIRIYSTLGREVYSMNRIDASRSMQELVWHGKDMNNVDVSSGVYVVRLSRGKAVASAKVVLLR